MMPNMDPRTMKSMLAKMGIKTSELNASRVVIELPDRDIVIENPQVTEISAQGSVSYQIAGSSKSVEKDVKVEITDEDIDTVAQQTGINDKERVKQALMDSNGDIAAAILALTGES